MSTTNRNQFIKIPGGDGNGESGGSDNFQSNSPFGNLGSNHGTAQQLIGGRLMNAVSSGSGPQESFQVVFSAQSRDAIIYVTVVLVIYIIIFVVLVVTSYRKSSALRETLNRHLRSHYATGPIGTPTILETDCNGDQVHCDTVDELHEGSIQL
ncbi:hypothetical protein SSS_07450 [Sarcoptes scabiei]|uniref:Uncharacterized protein n=1 Tax=Sarcoptes scabiei TaxID=52283 RepID=A0A834RCM4_SARSC|nr:hypothetical protein SSS_07450 [Sarcoptes scabiei]